MQNLATLLYFLLINNLREFLLLKILFPSILIHPNDYNHMTV